MKEKREIVELVELCRRNDRVAQRKIFERYKGVMYSQNLQTGTRPSLRMKWISWTLGQVI